jgi:adenylate kinase
MRKYAIMGIQGCGKGTQAKLLADDFHLVHISVGDIFRWNVQNHTKLAAFVKRVMNEGKLVPDDIVIDVVTSRLEEHDWNYGFILDGFPRNKAQAEHFLSAYDIDAVILIDVPDRVVMDRILARRLCSKCKRDYNMVSNPPTKEGVCDICGGEVVARPDDNEEAIRERLNAYHNETEPVLQLFRSKEKVVTVDGTKTPEEVQAEIRKKVPGLG